MLQELTGYFNIIKKTQVTMTVALCEIKKNLQGTNSEGKATVTQINDVEQKEERNIQPEKNEETRIQKKMRRVLGTSGTTLNIPTPKSEGCQKEKRKSKKLKRRGNRLSGSPGSSDSPKEVGPKEAHTKAHHNYITQDETEGENLQEKKIQLPTTEYP